MPSNHENSALYATDCAAGVSKRNPEPARQEPRQHTNCNARTRPAFEDLRAERTEGRMDFASDAQIVPDRATPRSTCSPVEDGQEISLPK